MRAEGEVGGIGTCTRKGSWRTARLLIVVISSIESRLHRRLLGRDGGLALRIRLRNLLIPLRIRVLLLCRRVLRVLADLRTATGKADGETRKASRGIWAVELRIGSRTFSCAFWYISSSESPSISRSMYEEN